MKENKGKKILDFIIKTMNGMAYGLFATLIIGTILSTIASFLTDGSYIEVALSSLSTVLKLLTGAGIGIGIALSLKQEGLSLIATAATGQIATYMSVPYGFKIGDPLVIYLVVVFTVLLCRLILKRKTPVDIIIIPLLYVIISTIITLLISPYVSLVTTKIGEFIHIATAYQPFIMGIIIAVIMGMALTAPISSAAIALMITLNGIAGGAAVVGCSVQMIGFAIMSRKDNNIGTVLSVAFGTSMLQFKNILRKPIIWVPTIVVSAILGPVATLVFHTNCSEFGAGMGTSGLVGPIFTLSTMEYSLNGWLSVILLMIVLPAILVLIVDIIFRKKQLIKDGDLKI
ncbi:MAG: PTS sugar transporter subunit IIC [Bacilli bacterium]|jgi:uncharacterized membrane protein|nr:PTS sugar transporter subunit IIC [Bacilli bacterium]MDY0064042.1 PTS sugar transporter subunit IIC [Bacilli bacterium]